MIDTFVELLEYLDDRGAKYGIEGIEIYKEIPFEARDPKVAYEYMQLKDISHIEPLSKGGDPAGDNWFLEDSEVNRARGAETATEAEQAAAEADGKRDASQLVRMVKMGAALSGGQMLIEGAGGLAVAEAGLLVTALPVVTTVAAVGAAGYGTYRVVKHARKNKWAERFQTFRKNCSYQRNEDGSSTFNIGGASFSISSK